MTRVLLYLALLVLACVPLAVGLIRANQLFVLRVKAGRLTFLRGRMPQQLFDQIADLTQKAPDGVLIAVLDGGRARLICRGQFDPGLVQQMRNVVGLYPLARLRAGGRPNSE